MRSIFKLINFWKLIITMSRRLIGTVIAYCPRYSQTGILARSKRLKIAIWR
jgi:hypothetical protein